MDTSSAIIGIVMLLLAAVPIFIFKRQKSKRDKLILGKLEALIKNKVSQLTVYEIWNDRSIGLDKTSDKLYYVGKNAETEIALTVDLTQVHSCSLLKTNYDGEPASNDPNSIRKITLILKSVSPKKEEIKLDFYAEEVDGANLNGELQLAQKWAELINRNLIIEQAKK